MLKLRGALEDAGWHAREAAGAVEETVVWRGAWAARLLARRAGGSRAGRAAGRARLLIERHVAWPIADLLRDRSAAAHAGIGAAAVVAALAAAAGGASLAGGGGEAAAPALTASVAAGEGGSSLEGVAPDFTSGQAGPPEATVAKPAPRDPAARTAWDFAQAFVLYEVGKADDVAEQFQRVASPALAEALRESPPRLPAEVEVPEARVLNVVVSDPEQGKVERAEASVSLVRLQAVSELRLSLKHEEEGWVVTEVRG